MARKSEAKRELLARISLRALGNAALGNVPYIPYGDSEEGPAVDARSCVSDQEVYSRALQERQRGIDAHWALVAKVALAIFLLPVVVWIIFSTVNWVVVGFREQRHDVQNPPPPRYGS